MSRFTEPLVVTPHPDGKHWITLTDFGYVVGTEDGDDTIDVYIGFHTDFASIPGLARIFLPKWGKYGNAAVIHDYLYWEQTRSRSESDRIMLEGMTVLEVHWAKKYPIYLAVRLGGWWGWWRNQIKKRRGTY